MDISDASAAPTEQMSPELMLIMNAISLASERTLSILRGELDQLSRRIEAVESRLPAVPVPRVSQSDIRDGTRCAEGCAEAELVCSRVLSKEDGRTSFPPGRRRSLCPRALAQVLE